MDDTLTEYRHPELGFTIALPAEIEIREDLPHVALLATEREELLPPEYFRGSLSVLVERGREGMGLDAYVEGSLDEQRRTLSGLRLIDREDTEVGGILAVRTLAHYYGGEALGVVVEQWRLIARGLGWVVTATSDAITYAARAEGFAACAETLRVEGS